MSTEFTVAHTPTPSAGRTSSTADAVPLPLATLDLRFKLHCDLRSSAEGSGTLDVISLQILFVFPASYNFSPEG